MCAETPEGATCAAMCDGGKACDPGFACEIVVPGLDLVRYCVHSSPRVCAPCKSADDCKSPGVDSGAECREFDGRFHCVKACSGDTDCGPGFTCQSIGRDGMGTCLPPSGTCTCTAKASAAKAKGKCLVKNGFGACEGVFACGPDGPGTCLGVTPKAESCNLKDDDCDGDTDEDFPADPCEMTNDLGTCPGVLICNHGAVVCDGPYAAEEECNGADDDCDGKADEGFADMDGDGLADCVDPDRDGDGIDDTVDNCPGVNNPGQDDTDKDGVGDACDPDMDGDGVANAVDNCPLAANPDQTDCDADGAGAACDLDDDRDGVPDFQDICLCVFDPEQADLDGDGLGDSCDPDRDNDGIPNEVDNCPDLANPDQEDLNHDGIGDACVADWDGDGVFNEDDNCAWVANAGQQDFDGDGVGDACDCDSDGDDVGEGVVESCPPVENPDNCRFLANPDQADLDADKKGNPCDPDRDGDGDPNDTDCEPDNSTVSHLQFEACNGIDDDCDSIADPAGASGCVQYHYDADADGYGTQVVRCLCAPAGFYSTVKGGDCMDTNAAAHPNADEVCDGVDNDCNVVIDDENATGCTVFYRDADGDGWGDAAMPTRCLCATEPGSFYTTTQVGDCDDVDPAMHPGAVESCNGRDDDCDGKPDTPGAVGCSIYFRDDDEDGYGTAETRCLCAPAAPFNATQAGDCGGSNPAVYPGAPERCDELDNDCDASTDEGYSGLGQACEVGVGACLAKGKKVCTADGKGVECGAKAGKPTTEVCDGLDDDCDGATDEELGSTTCGLGECRITVQNCLAGKPQACVPNSGTAEVCDFKDNDCDGSTDEDLGTTTCGKGPCWHTVQNCVGGKTVPCNAFEGAGTELCGDSVDNDCDGVTDETCAWKSCLEILQKGLAKGSGVYTLDPDGIGGNAAFDAYCDMATAGGGWTLILSVTAYDISAAWKYDDPHWIVAGAPADLSALSNLGADRGFLSEAYGRLSPVNELMLSIAPRATTSAGDLSASTARVVYASTKTLKAWVASEGVSKTSLGTGDYRYGLLVGKDCVNLPALAPSLAAECNSVVPFQGPTLMFNQYDDDPKCTGDNAARIVFGLGDGNGDFSPARHLAGGSGRVSKAGGYNVVSPACATGDKDYSLRDDVQYLIWER
jgi:hypothetical protein